MSDADHFLYVALYDLSAGHKQVLLFKKDDKFIPVPNSTSNPNWALCVDMKGNVGYVPYTYVEKKQVRYQEYVWLIEDALEKLHVDSPSSTSKLTREALKSLTAQRNEILESKELLDASPDVEAEDLPDTNHVPPKFVDSSPLINSGRSSRSESNASDLRDTPQGSIGIPESTSSVKIKPTAESCSQTDSIKDFEVPNWLVPSLIERVRHKTNISHENSKAAVGIMLNTFAEAIPMLDVVWLQMKKHLFQSESEQGNPNNVVYSEDQRKLLDIFKQLWYCKNDEQQRSWPVHEDEDLISGLLHELNNILLDANPRVTREIVRCDEYEMVDLLATYYQMEPRKTLRIKMLHVFLTLCELDTAVVTHLLNSVLPMELARDIQDNFEDGEKTLHSSFLLSVIFSTGEQPPTGTYGKKIAKIILYFINKKFLHFLFEKLEEVVKDGDEDMGQNLLSIILAFNLHFVSVEDNVVLATLKEIQYAQALTEKLVFLINREEDPCRILIPDVKTSNSVLKFMVDLLSFPSLIDLFYLNDIKVLLDIIVRQLTDLLPGEKKRLEYLRLVRNLLRNSNYSDHQHQLEGLKKCFRSVFTQEFPDDNEVNIVNEMTHEFQSLFGDI